MSTDAPPDIEAIQQRLYELTGDRYTIRGCERAPSGHANTTWMLDSDPRPLVIKVQSTPSVVHQRDPAFEPNVLDGLAATRVPVPEVVARDPHGGVFAAPWFAMSRIDGRSLPDDAEASYARDGWFAETGAAEREKIWNGFVDVLGDLHATPVASFGPSPRGGSHSRVLDYLADSLRDGAAEAKVPLQDRVLEWLRAEAPVDADALAAPCLADARLANVMERDGEIVALLDWELAWIGNPCGDIGYHLHLDERYARVAGRRLSGLPDRDVTWDRWQTRTGYEVHDRAYWETFGGFVMAITATRFLVQLQQVGAIPHDVDVEGINSFVADLVGVLDS